MSSLNVKRNYTKVPNSIIRGEGLSVFERVVLIYIFSFDECFASQATMARVLGMSASTVQRAIRRLTNARIISKHRRNEGYAITYTVNKRSEWNQEESA